MAAVFPNCLLNATLQFKCNAIANSTVWDTFLSICKRISDIITLFFVTFWQKTSSAQKYIRKHTHHVAIVSLPIKSWWRNGILLEYYGILLDRNLYPQQKKVRMNCIWILDFIFFALCSQGLQLGNLGECFHLNPFTSSISHFIWKHKFIVTTRK